MSTNFKTGKVRFGYVNVFTPRVDGDDKEGKYQLMIIIDKKDKETLTALKTAIEAAKEKGKSERWNGKIPAKLSIPLRDGDEERPDSPELAGKFFVNAKSKNKPQVVKFVAGKLQPITDPAEFYSGCYGKATLGAYAFSFNGNNGIGLGLNNLLFLSDGESLAGGTSAFSDFEDEEDTSEEEDDNWMG